MTPALEVWSSCTTVFAGGLKQLPAVLGGREMLLIADDRLTAQVEAVREQLRPLEVVLIGSTGSSASSGSPGSSENPAGLVREAIARRTGAVPVALGGGGVMDVVRLAALAAADPAADGFAAAADGPTVLPTRAVNPTVCIPTTVGTAAEVSAVAVRHGPAGAAMIISPGLRSAGVVIDPAMTASLPTTALAAGLVEPWARVCVPAIAGQRLRFQDGLVNGLAATILGLGDEIAGVLTHDAGRGVGNGASSAAGQVSATDTVSGTDNPIDDDWRSGAALASIQTHLGLLALGRAPAGHVLWPLATEVVRATGLTKSAALAALVPAWLRCIAAGAIGSGWGSADRVRSILGLDPATAAELMEGWLRALALPTLLPAALDVDAVVARVLNPWQASGWFLSGASRAEIAVLVGVATQPGKPAEST